MLTPIIGRRNVLQVFATHDAGLLLDGGELGKILLPTKYVPPELEPGENVEVFLSLDSDDRPIATTESPIAMVGEFASLRVVETTRIGAFLDWGLPKDLLLPFSNQIQPVRAGEKVLVRIYFDQSSRRLVATAKIRKYVSNSAPASAAVGDEVSLRIAEESDLGHRAIVDNLYWGLLPHGISGAVPPLGETCTGYITRIQEEGLVDLGLQPPGYAKVPAAAEQILTALAEAKDGFLPIHDKSPPEQVRETLNMSKKVFKQAAGHLYKAGKVRISNEGIHLQEA